MVEIYLTRHGQTEWNLEGRSQGLLDSSLTDLGRSQAEWLGSRLQDIYFDAVYTSTSSRAIETAQIVLKSRSDETIQDERLCEMNFGDWQGRLWHDIKNTEPDRYHDFWKKPSAFVPDQGEDFKSFISRVMTALDDITCKHANQRVLLVVHGGVLKAIFSAIEKKDLDAFWTQEPYMHSTNLSILQRRADGDFFTLKGCIDHYPQDEKDKMFLD